MSKFKVGERVYSNFTNEHGEVTKIDVCPLVYRVRVDSGISMWVAEDELDYPKPAKAPDEIVVNGVKYLRAAEPAAPKYKVGDTILAKGTIQNLGANGFYYVRFLKNDGDWRDGFVSAASIVGLWEDK